MDSNKLAQVQPSYFVRTAFARLIQAVTELLHAIENGCVEQTHYDFVRSYLLGVPLSTGEHALATQRLKNAEHYASAGERGAARYEISLMTQFLISQARASD